MARGAERRIGVLGHGAIGSLVAAQIAAGHVAGGVLEGVILRRRQDLPYEQFSLDEALERCDMIVECAGQQAVREHAVRILEAGADLLVISVGVMADREFAARLELAGPGRLYFSSGAVGGLDLLASGARMGAFSEVVITTRKLPATLAQPWMSQAQRTELESSAAPVEVYSGSARQAAQQFPKSLNVAAAVALAVGNWDVVSVRLLADPDAALTEHVIEARGASGEYSFSIRNQPSEHNPRTSGVVPWAVLRSLETALGARGGLL